MEELMGLLKGILTSQPLLQVFVGGATFLLIAWMVMKARGDRQHLPPPAPATIADVPQPFLQGPREVVDILRELRDYGRRQTEDTGRIAECSRIMREHVVKQTDILEDMREDQRVENRVAAERHLHPSQPK